jgi:LruC domain-containing protein
MKRYYPIVCLFFLLQSCHKERNPPIPSKLPDTAIASSIYYPANNWGILAYEDKWPLLNDYDMNDLVVAYQYRIDKNTEGNAISLTCDFAIDAVGANYLNGFAIQFPFSPAKVKSVTGQRLIENYITLNANGTETGLNNVVIVPFDNTEALIRSHDSSHFINVYNGKEKIGSDTAHIVITFVAPLDITLLGSAPFDPFLISNLQRNHEIHLPGSTPTAKADMTLFGKYDDSKAGISYESAGKLPWALNFPTGKYAYPVEGKSLTATYLHFADWAASKGTQYTDWQTNKSPSYLYSPNIYQQE